MDASAEMKEIYNLLQNDVPDGRQNLEDNYLNLNKVASYCEGNYLQVFQLINENKVHCD